MCHKMPQDINLYCYDLVSLTSSEHFKHAKHCIYFSTDTSVMFYIYNVRRQQEKKHTGYPLKGRKTYNIFYYAAQLTMFSLLVRILLHAAKSR